MTLVPEAWDWVTRMAGAVAPVGWSSAWINSTVIPAPARA